MKDKKAKSKQFKIFIKSMIYTAAIISLFLVGYFTAAIFMRGFN